jgi:hypothetical protein
MSLLLFRVFSATKDPGSPPVPVIRPVPADYPVVTEPPVTPLPDQEIQRGLSEDTGAEHILALDLILRWIREGKVLTPEDARELLVYAAHPKPISLEDGEWEERVNAILNLLRSQPGGVPGLADTMLGMARAESDGVMRMYVLQHIFLWIPDEPNQENREELTAYLRSIAETPSDAHAGAAVMFLSDLERNSGHPADLADEEIITRAALRLVEDTAARPDVRISALHTCTERGTPDALPTAREIAADTTLMIPLRKAAIHCIGELGSPEDRELLERIAATDPVFTAATTPALERLGR